MKNQQVAGFSGFVLVVGTNTGIIRPDERVGSNVKILSLAAMPESPKRGILLSRLRAFLFPWASFRSVQRSQQTKMPTLMSLGLKSRGTLNKARMGHSLASAFQRGVGGY